MAMFHFARFYIREKDRECMRLYGILKRIVKQGKKIIRNGKKNERKILCLLNVECMHVNNTF